MRKKKKNYYLVEDYTFAGGKKDMMVFPYTSKFLALGAIPLHYERLIGQVKQCGWEVVEGCCEDDHAWLITNDGDHFKIRFVESLRKVEV